MTETTQPDPQVVACRSCENRGYKTIGGYMGGYRIPCPDCKPEPTASKPLTVADGTGPLIEAILRKLDREDVPLRGEAWRATIAGPYALTLTQWADSGERGEPTGPKVRVTITVHVEDAP